MCDTGTYGGVPAGGDDDDHSTKSFNLDSHIQWTSHGCALFRINVKASISHAGIAARKIFEFWLYFNSAQL